MRLSRLRYAGHAIRMEDNRLPKIILHAETNEGQRKIGRPRKKFRQCFKEDFKSFNIPVENFNKIALDRKKWRKLIINGAQTFKFHRKIDACKLVRKDTHTE